MLTQELADLANLASQLAPGTPSLPLEGAKGLGVCVWIPYLPDIFIQALETLTFAVQALNSEASSWYPLPILFSLLDNILLYRYFTFCFPVHRWQGTLVVSTFGLLSILLP